MTKQCGRRDFNETYTNGWREKLSGTKRSRYGKRESVGTTRIGNQGRSFSGRSSRSELGPRAVEVWIGYRGFSAKGCVGMTPAQLDSSDRTDHCPASNQGAMEFRCQNTLVDVPILIGGDL